MNQETRDLVRWWKLRAAEEADPFVSFFIAYMCLDAWMTAASGSDSDAGKIRWLKTPGNPLREHWQGTSGLQEPLQGLREIGKVEDMRPRHRGEYTYLRDIHDFNQVVDFIYQIRCNLFHGGKSNVNTNDRSLVKLSSAILANWIEHALEEATATLED